MKNVKRWKAVCAYDGTDFSGFQYQKNGRGIQNILEEKLSTITREAVRIHGSGRTDAGAHAAGQTFHFESAWSHLAEDLRKALNTLLPSSIAILCLEEISLDFHARFSAIGKYYTYQFCIGYALPTETRYWHSLGNVHLEQQKMHAAALSLTGTHNFEAFSSKPRNMEGTGNPVKTLQSCTVEVHKSHYTLHFKGSGFLYKMVRTLTGAIIQAGLGALSIETIAELLKNPANTARPQCLAPLPAKGLCLREVFYN